MRQPPLSARPIKGCVRCRNGILIRNILANLKWPTKDAKPGEMLVFWYSCHGSYQIDFQGDEENNRDECLIPHDCDTAGIITGYDLQVVIQWIPPEKVNLEIFLDSCFSGTATRSLTL
jgi:hypothetical protein